LKTLFKYFLPLSFCALHLYAVKSFAQEIVFLEEGREILLKTSVNTKMKVGEKVNFEVKNDIYTEDNLVIAGESKVIGKLISKNKADVFSVKIDFVYDVHGNKIKVRTAKEGNQHLQMIANRTEFSVYVDEGFWFSY
jgi:hypothetical protein